MSEELPFEEKIVQQLRKNQDLGYAIIGGISAALIGGALWAVITVSTGYQIGYMAIGIGFLVGFAVRFFGAGVDIQYRVIGAACALLGCMLGNLFGQIWFIAEAESLGYFETLGYLDFSLIGSIYQETFSFMDLLFYGIAIYEGYRFSVREVSDEIVEQYNATGTVPQQANSNLRLPIVIICFVAIGALFYYVSAQGSGVKTYFYESGEKMSEGELVDGKENGAWTLWYPSGQIQLTSNYKNGIEEGEWQWLGENGNLLRKASYKSGLLEGVNINFHQNGIASDSGNYVQGRKEGMWVYRNEEGNLTERGTHLRDLNEGEWLTFYPDGSLSSKGSYKKGIRTGHWQFWYPGNKQFQEADYLNQDEFKIMNAWDFNGKQTLSNGSGTLYHYDVEGKVLEVSQVKDGKQTGTWTTFYPNGNKSEEGEFKGNLQYITTTWNPHGKQVITNGSGTYASYYDLEQVNMFETGTLRGGLREGLWTRFYDTGTDTLQTVVYINGKMNGLLKLYFQNGLTYSEGEMKDDKREGEWKWYTEDGSLESSVTFVNGKKEGTQYFWDTEGNVMKEEIYKDDELVYVNLTHEE